LERHEKTERPDAPTIGLLLCKSAKKTVVELTLPNVRQHPRKGTGAQRVEDLRNGK
jgi:hypothetical protein